MNSINFDKKYLLRPNVGTNFLHNAIQVFSGYQNSIFYIFVYKTISWMMSQAIFFFFSSFSASKILCPTPIGKKYLTYHEDLKRHFATTTFNFDHWNVSEEQALRVKIRSVEVPISINWYRRKRYQKVWKPLR